MIGPLFPMDLAIAIQIHGVDTWAKMAASPYHAPLADEVLRRSEFDTAQGKALARWMRGESDGTSLLGEVSR